MNGIALLLAAFCAELTASPAEEPRDVYPLLDGLYVCADAPACLGHGHVYRVTVYHSYPTPLHRFRIAGAHAELAIRVEPQELPALSIGQTSEFEVHVAPLPNTRLTGDRVTVPLTFSADELASQRPWPLVIPLTAAAEEELRNADALPVGTVEVRVRRWAGWETWAYTAGSAAILAALAWRWWRGRPGRASRPRLPRAV